MRVALVGAGYVASRHLMALRDLPGVEIVGICDLDQERAGALATQFKIPHVHRTLAEMAAATRPDVIHILTPPSSHCPLALEALHLGCHVFVEKPMAETLEECDLMIALAREKALVLSVNHSARFEPPILDALARIRRGECGDLLAVHHFRGSDYPAFSGGKLPAIYRQGSYPFRDLGVHALYLFEAILGEVQSLRVQTKSTGRDPLLTFDEWHLDATCAHGQAYAWLSWNMLPVRNEFWIQGTKGMLEINCFLQSCELYKTYPGPKQLHAVINGLRHALGRLGRIPAYLLGVLTGRVRPSPGIYASVQAFHRALAAGTPAPVSAEEGRRAVSWVLAGSHEADAQKQLLEAARQQPAARPARVLVTGANGFLGRALLRRLKDNGEQPRLLLRQPAAAGSPAHGLDAVYGSLGEPDTVDRAVSGVEVVYHLGAAMKGGKEEFEAGTVWGTRNIVDACLRHGVKRLIYVSSMGLLDHAGHPAGSPVTEDSPLEPHPDRRGIYTQTKLLAERELLDATRERGLPAVVIRPGQIFGPGSELVTPNGVIRIAGRWIVAGDGSRTLPLVYLDDVVDGLLAAEIPPAALGQVIHLVDPAVVTQNQYLSAAQHALSSTPILRVPVFLLRAAGWCFDRLSQLAKRSLPLSVYRVDSLRPLSPCDASRARQLLGWSPRVGAPQGLARTFPPQPGP